MEAGGGRRLGRSGGGVWGGRMTDGMGASVRDCLRGVGAWCAGVFFNHPGAAAYSILSCWPKILCTHSNTAVLALHLGWAESVFGLIGRISGFSGISGFGI